MLGPETLGLSLLGVKNLGSLGCVIGRMAIDFLEDSGASCVQKPRRLTVCLRLCNSHCEFDAS